jgi:hypothetical protein
MQLQMQMFLATLGVDSSLRHVHWCVLYYECLLMLPGIIEPSSWLRDAFNASLYWSRPTSSCVQIVLSIWALV